MKSLQFHAFDYIMLSSAVRVSKKDMHVNENYVSSPIPWQDLLLEVCVCFSGPHRFNQ